MHFSTDGDDTQSAQFLYVEWFVDAMRLKIIKAQPQGVPVEEGRETDAVGLPDNASVLSAQMQIVNFTVPIYFDLDTRIVACIK